MIIPSINAILGRGDLPCVLYHIISQDAATFIKEVLQFLEVAFSLTSTTAFSQRGIPVVNKAIDDQKQNFFSSTYLIAIWHPLHTSPSFPAVETLIQFSKIDFGKDYRHAAQIPGYDKRHYSGP